MKAAIKTDWVMGLCMVAALVTLVKDWVVDFDIDGMSILMLALTIGYFLEKVTSRIDKALDKS
jgi:hypothetical protein